MQNVNFIYFEVYISIASIVSIASIAILQAMSARHAFCPWRPPHVASPDTIADTIVTLQYYFYGFDRRCRISRDVLWQI